MQGPKQYPDPKSSEKSDSDPKQSVRMHNTTKSGNFWSWKFSFLWNSPKRIRRKSRIRLYGAHSSWQLRKKCEVCCTWIDQLVQNAVSYKWNYQVPDWGDKVNSGIGLSYRPARLHRLAGLCMTTLCRSQLYPSIRDYEFANMATADKTKHRLIN